MFRPLLPRSLLLHRPTTAVSTVTAAADPFCTLPTARPTQRCFRQPHQIHTRRHFATPRSPQARRILELESRAAGSQPQTYPDTAFPTDAFMSAYKSKALPLRPHECKAILTRYIALRGALSNKERGRVEHGRTLLEEFNISPPTLSILAYILFRGTKSVPPKNPKHNPYQLLAQQLMHICSALDDPTATIYLYQIATHPPPNGPSPSHDTIRILTNRLQRIARATSNPAATYAYADSLPDTRQKMEWMVLAAERGISRAWVEIGKLRRARGDAVGAREAFGEAAKAEEPEGILELAELNLPFEARGPREGEENGEEVSGNLPKKHIEEGSWLYSLIRAAGGGSTRAMFLLGLYYMY